MTVPNVNPIPFSHRRDKEMTFVVKYGGEKNVSQIWTTWKMNRWQPEEEQEEEENDELEEEYEELEEEEP